MTTHGDKWFQLAMLAKEITNPRDFEGRELIARALEAAADLFPPGDEIGFPQHDPAKAVGTFIDALRDAIAPTPGIGMSAADLSAHGGEIPL